MGAVKSSSKADNKVRTQLEKLPMGLSSSTDVTAVLSSRAKHGAYCSLRLLPTLVPVKRPRTLQGTPPKKTQKGGPSRLQLSTQAAEEGDVFADPKYK